MYLLTGIAPVSASALTADVRLDAAPRLRARRPREQGDLRLDATPRLSAGLRLLLDVVRVRGASREVPDPGGDLRPVQDTWHRGCENM